MAYICIPYKPSSFVPVRLPVRLGNINCYVTQTIVNRTSWPKSPYKLSSFVLVRLGNIDSYVTQTTIIRPPWPTSPYKVSSFVPVRMGIINSDVQYT